MKRYSEYIFGLVLLVELLGQLLRWESVRYTKPLLMPTLMIFFVFNYPRGTYSSIFTLTLAALLFSFLGDVSLMFQANELYFIVGLLCFLTAHVGYILVFGRSTTAGFSLHQLRFKLAVPLLLYAGVLFYFVVPASGSLAAPVVIYGLVILTMIFFAWNRYGLTNQASFTWGMLGAILFVVSDSFLAWNKFYHPLPLSGFIIMGTYALGQYFIIKSIIAHNLNGIR